MYTNDDLVTLIKRESSLPESSDLTNPIILAHATNVVKNLIGPALMKIREEFFVFPKSYTITANQSAYRISPRAIGSTVRDVQIQDSAGNIKSLPWVNPEDIKTSSTGKPTSFYLKGSNIVLYPTPNQTIDTLIADILIRQSTLVEVSATAKVTAIDTLTNTVTVDNLPTTWAAATVVDLVKGSSPYEILDIEYSISSVGASTIVFSSLPSTLEVDDYVCLKGETFTPNLPEDLFQVLIKLTAGEILSSIGQQDEATPLKEEAGQALQLHLSNITNRVKGEAKKFKTRLL